MIKQIYVHKIQRVKYMIKQIHVHEIQRVNI